MNVLGWTDGGSGGFPYRRITSFTLVTNEGSDREIARQPGSPGPISLVTDA